MSEIAFRHNQPENENIRAYQHCDGTSDCFYRRPADFLRTKGEYTEDPILNYNGSKFSFKYLQHLAYKLDKKFVYFLYRHEPLLYIILGFVIFNFLVLFTVNFNIDSQILFVYTALTTMFLFLYVQKDNDKIKLFVKFTAILLVYRYLYWRTTESLRYDGFWDFFASMMVYISEVYATLLFSLGIFTSLMLLNRRVINLEGVPSEELPTVDVFVPTYNEPYEIVTDTVMSAMMFEYPRERFRVHILDDGGSDQKCNDKNLEKAKNAQSRRVEFLEFAERTGANYLTRAKNLHAKAGNMNSALKVTNGDLVLILDCDHIPTRDFLQNTVGWFMKVPRMFLVQTPHAFYNPDPIEKNLNIFRKAPAENDMFYKYIQRGHDFWDSSFFCGSAAVIRRRYLQVIGGIAGDTITEDAETALTMHAAGLKSAYIAIPMVRGLQAESFDGLVLQRVRWTQGMIQIFILKNSWKYRGLSWFQKLSYTSASFFWFFSIGRITFLIAPLFYIFFGLKSYVASDLELIAYTVPHLAVALIISQHLYGSVRWGYFSEVYETSLALFTLPATIEVMMRPRDPEFEVTPKGEDTSQDRVSSLASPFVWFAMLLGSGFVVGFYKWFAYPELRDALVMTLSWNAFNSIFVVTSLAIASEKKQLRQYVRIPSNETAILKVEGETFIGKISDISLSGIAINFSDETLEKLKPHLSPRQMMQVLIYDMDGRLTPIYGSFLRLLFGKRFTMRFDDTETNLELRKKLVALIFGEKTRWHELDYQEQNRSPFSSLWLLFSNALKSAYIGKAFSMTFSDTKEAVLKKFRKDNGEA
jgi:cellulose synthase (UDP-forming)